jgi:hypothetical protein
MSNPYQPPNADLSPIRRSWRLGHSFIAFGSGLVVPPLIIYLIARFLLPDVPIARGNSTFWGAVILGSMLAAAAVYRHKRISLWLAVITGPAIVFLLALAPVVWTEVLGAV